MKLTETVRLFILQRANELSATFISSIEEELSGGDGLGEPIESPIEQLFLTEWRFREYDSQYRYPFDLEAQYSDPIIGKYILDFSVNFLTIEIVNEFSDVIESIAVPHLGIELDGHVWHEKTKRQVEYGKERDRFLISKGWKILHFAGSEIYRDPSVCLTEVLKIAFEMRREYLGSLRIAKG